MYEVCTVNELLKPLMGKPSIKGDRCAVCGRSWPLNDHHVVRRGAGKLVRDGHEVPKPTIVLCGSGNTGGCHGLAHQNRLHFRWCDEPGKGYLSTTGVTRWDGCGHWEYLITDEPTKYQEALEMDGWERL